VHGRKAFGDLFCYRQLC